MPKVKTNQAAAKRFTKTKSGKFKRPKAFARHLATGKSAKRRRRLRTLEMAVHAEEARLRRLLPYA